MPATPTAVLVHGFGTSSRVWRAVLPLLDAGGGEALVPDLPGFGSSTDGRHTVDGMADALLEAVQARGLTRYVLVGHSMGAKVAAVLAARRPAGLAGLLLVAPSPPSPEPMTDEGRRDLKAAHGHPDLLREHYLTITRADLTPADLDALVEDGVRADASAWAAWPDHGSREDRSGDMMRVQVPVHLVSSATDPVITPQVMHAQVRPAFPDATAQTVLGSGHLLPLERPQPVAGVVRGVLQQLS